MREDPSSKDPGAAGGRLGQTPGRKHCEWREGSRSRVPAYNSKAQLSPCLPAPRGTKTAQNKGTTCWRSTGHLPPPQRAVSCPGPHRVQEGPRFPLAARAPSALAAGSETVTEGACLAADALTFVSRWPCSLPSSLLSAVDVSQGVRPPPSPFQQKPFEGKIDSRMIVH